MNGIRQSGLIVVLMVCALAFQGCTQSSQAPDNETHAHDEQSDHHDDHGQHNQEASNADTHEHGGSEDMHEHASVEETKDLASAGFLQLKNHYFKLAPDIVDAGESHLDFYVRDTEGKHLTGANITLHLTAPSGQKDSFELKEDIKGEHYHTKTVLSENGEYNSVVQVSVNETKYNPRFTFNK